MCTVCAMGGAPCGPCPVKTASMADITLTIPGNDTTTETITIGGTVNETLEVLGDTDWFRLDLVAGQTVQIDLFGNDHDGANGLPALEDHRWLGAHRDGDTRLDVGRA